MGLALPLRLDYAVARQQNLHSSFHLNANRT